MSIRRPYPQIYDSNGNVPVEMQIDSPLTEEFTTVAAANVRTLLDAAGRLMHVGDAAVSPRGSKNVIWSSEGYTYQGAAIPKLTNAQKAASGSIATNIGAATAHSGFSFPSVLDFSPYHYLLLMIVLGAFTGGTSPSIQFELDFLDDTSPTANKFAVWNPAAATATASYFVTVGEGLTVPPTTAPTGYANAAVPAGWTAYAIPLVVGPNGNFSWTVTGAPTTAPWTAWLYGQY